MQRLVHECFNQNVEKSKTKTGTPETGASELQRGGGTYYQGTRIMRDEIALERNQPMPKSSYWQALCGNSNLRDTDF